MDQGTSKGSGTRKRLPGLTVKEGYLLHPFDEANGVRTSGLIAGRHLKTGHKNDRQITAYYGVAPSVFLTLVRRWQRHHPAGHIEHTTFIDIGAGMGRAMLLGSEMHFREVIGVELHPALVRMARRNLAVWRKSRSDLPKMRLLHADVLDLPFPPGPCVAFLFNPFGAPVMRRLLTKIAKEFANRPGELDLLYVNNEQEGELEMQRGFVRFFLGRVNRSPADTIADRRILSNQPDGEYVASTYEDCSIWRWMGR